MVKHYVDYTNQTVITIPDHFINTQTGDIEHVSQSILNQLQYHTDNNTLSHLIFTALHHYMYQPNAEPVKVAQLGSNDILKELVQIKKMLQEGKYVNTNQKPNKFKQSEHQSKALNLQEVEDVLEAFGG